MINEAVKFLTEEVNKYLSIKLSIPITDPRLVAGNIAKALDPDSSSGANALTNRAIVSLINIEEDRISKQQEPYIRSGSRIIYKNPAVPLNLYLLFASNLQTYQESLRMLAYIIQFFQQQNVFTPTSHPSLDPQVQKLVADLYTLSFEQVNHLWGTLGGKYLPSVLYKIRLVTIDEGLPYASGEFITEIDIENKQKAPLS